MMVNHDIATVREFMFYARPQIMERLFLQLIKKNFDQPRKVPPPVNYHKTLNPSLFVPSTKISEKISPH